MRIRLPLGRTLFFVSAFLFALMALLPLRLVLGWMELDARGLAAREAEGSIWLGGLREAQFGAVPLGDLQAQLRTLPLFLGRARVDLVRRETDGRLSAGATVTRHGFGLDDIKGELDVGAAFAPLPISTLDLNGVTARFAGGLCSSAQGMVRVSMRGEVAGIALPGGLSGNARCDEGALLLPLTSQSAMERLDIRLFEDGRYRVTLLVRPTDDALRDRLLASGFALTNEGYALRVDGAF